jgi:signal transduction histidine kinase
MDLDAPRRRELTAAVVTGVAGFAFAGWALTLSAGARQPYPWWVLAPAESVGVAFLGVGLFAWIRQPETKRMARLVVAVGITWYAGDLQFSTDPVLFRLGFWLYYIHVVVLAHVLLSYPEGRLARPVARFTIAAQYATVLVTQGMRVLVEKSPPPQGWGDPRAPISVWAPIGSVLGAVLTVVAVGLVVQRWRAEPPPVRRARGLFWLAVAFIGAVVAFGSVAGLVRASVAVHGVLLLLYALAHFVLGAALLTELLRTQLTTHHRVTQLLAELHLRPVDDARLHRALGEALEDPDLTLHYRRADSDDYVNARGQPAPLPTGADRAVTLVRGPDGQPLAALVHNPVLVRLPQYRRRLHAVVAAAGLAIENARLQAENRAHLRGLLEAEQVTRRAIRAMLHDGPQHRLSAIQLMLGQVRKRHGTAGLDADLGQIADELQATVQDLREVTQGIYPSNLRSSGLGDALDSLAQRSPIPLVLDIPANQWPPEVEETAFFIISEAVGNAQKHANATRITVLVCEVAGHLTLDVSDDGDGAAEISPNGTGLRGMRDRVAAHEGTLTIDSPCGHGTTIRAVLPCV